MTKITYKPDQLLFDKIKMTFSNMVSYDHDPSNPNYKKLIIWFCFDRDNYSQENADYSIIIDEICKSKFGKLKIEKKGEEARCVKSVSYSFTFENNCKDNIPIIELSWTEIENINLL